MNHIDPLTGRDPSGPVVAGDLIDGREVAGFAFAGVAPDDTDAAGAPARLADSDRLLFKGDEELTVVPETVAPLTARDAERLGVPAIDRLPRARRVPADQVAPGLAGRMEAILRRTDTSWRAIALPLFEALNAAGHDLWIAGGAVRDMVTGTDPAQLKDLDLAGTAPPGRFHDLATPPLQLAGGGESFIKVSQDTLICWTEPFDRAVADGTHVEYRSLALTGFGLPGTGSSLEDDATQRDLTVNTLHYDRRRAEVLDPTGDGLSDLTGAVRRLDTRLAARDARRTAAVVLRAIKQAARWETTGEAVDLDPIRDWISGLRAGLWEAPDHEAWAGIRADYDEYLVRRVPPEQQRRLAARLGERAETLIARLLGVTV